MITRLRFAAVAIVLMMIVVMTLTLAACGGSTHNPASPTPPSSATVTALSVTSAPPTGTTFQLTATARMSDGTSQDVTASATWESSNTSLATVSTAGVVTVRGDGELDVRATYKGVSGSMHLLVATVNPKIYALHAVVQEVAPNAKPIAGAHARILDGSHEATSDNAGTFTLTDLPAATYLLEVTRDGYDVWESEVVITDRDIQVSVDMYPTAPKDSSGATATARCNDGSWSWAQTKSNACTGNGGVAYTVCPGPLCNQ